MVFSSRRVIMLFFFFISSSDAWRTHGDDGRRVSSCLCSLLRSGPVLVRVQVRPYLHLLVHFHVDGFDFVQLVPESDQRVLVGGERPLRSRSQPPPTTLRLQNSARRLPASREYPSPGVSWPAPFLASSTPERPAHSPHPDRERAHRRMSPAHRRMSLTAAVRRPVGADIPPSAACALRCTSRPGPGGTACRCPSPPTRRPGSPGWGGARRKTPAASLAIARPPSRGRPGSPASYLQLLLALQQDEAGLAPQVLVFLLQFDDVVLGDGQLRAAGPGRPEGKTSV